MSNEVAFLREMMRHIPPGQSMVFDAPSVKQPAARNFYQRLNRVAYSLFGPGAYSLRSGRGEVMVARKPR